jgi:hypothetical protein
MIFFIDDTVRHQLYITDSVTSSNILPDSSYVTVSVPVGIPQESMHFHVELSLKEGLVDSTTPFPCYFDVDYVRVWQDFTNLMDARHPPLSRIRTQLVSLERNGDLLHVFSPPAPLLRIEVYNLDGRRVAKKEITDCALKATVVLPNTAALLIGKISTLQGTQIIPILF